MLKIDSNTLPDQPGVYIFKKGSKPIYIGKSINIRARVKSHIAQAKLSNKEGAIVEGADSLDYHITLSNFDALLLESQLIKKYHPKYNIVWKDGKNYLYIKITTGERYPKVYPVRKENDKKSIYFGPFSSTKMTYTLLYELRRIVPFCTHRKVGKRPCFYSKIGLCNPCPNYIHAIESDNEKKLLTDSYNKNINKLIDMLNGKSHKILTNLEKKLESYSDKKDYESAILIRDRLLQFTSFLERRSFKEIPYTSDMNPDEIRNEFSEFMKKHFNKQIEGDEYRIECYDISNLFGKQPTGSMVVYRDGMFSSSDYKKFSVHHKKISDIHMLEEVLRRRLKHEEWGMPDLVILDGGKPQLRMINELFRKLNVSIPLISIAKRPDRILTPAANYKTIHLNRRSLLFKVIQALRDESHRFAKKYHVLLRNRNVLN